MAMVAASGGCRGEQLILINSLEEYDVTAQAMETEKTAQVVLGDLSDQRLMIFPWLKFYGPCEATT
ncbi:hypothetical protein DSUL_130019 [Desulfovibrionales bacterium]